MTAILALIRKDLLLFVQDRRALLLSLVLPIILGSFMGYVFGGNGKDASPIDIALVVEDDGAMGKRIAEALRGEKNFRIKEMPLEQAKEQVRKGKLSVAVQVPAGFGDAAGQALFSASAKPTLPLFYDPSQATTLAMVKGILTQHVMQVVSAEMFSGDAGQKMIDDSLRQLEELGTSSAENNDLHDFLASLKKYQSTTQKASASAPKGGLSMPFEMREEEMSSQVKFNGYGHAFAGMGVQFILMMSIDFGVGILLAQRMGLWQRLLAAPISVNHILAARLLSGALVAFGVYCVIFAFAAIAFGMQVANLPGFLGIGMAFALMTAAMGLFIAAFGRTPEAARGIALLVTLLMVMLGGAWVPTFVFPAWVQQVTLFIPTRWAIDGISGMTWRAQGMDFALQCMGVLLGFGAAFAAAAFWQFGRLRRAS